MPARSGLVVLVALTTKYDQPTFSLAAAGSFAACQLAAVVGAHSEDASADDEQRE